jgi:HTH-type transcriptional regulator / antitoxin HigA
MKYEIKSKKAYHELMVEIYNLMNRGEAKLNASELKKLAAMSAAAEQYEDKVLGLQIRKEPQTIVEIVELKSLLKSWVLQNPRYLKFSTANVNLIFPF